MANDHCPLSKAAVARVMPQPGHGRPVMEAKKHGQRDHPMR
ncbi:hypothetical protein DES53_11039 [Roseimicrobium gellanilyticum]|uniref:Uncharacterized protein n=1 Tax=Roseimicrobium gellanilyticum TaxID=748857 RepID=A0A366HA12_9BACT|nr:hypothetical protein DES53_11039 [Roseimicrobium gellanilyticum]